MDNNNSSLNFIPRNEIHFSENQFRFDEQRVSIRSKFRLFSIIISTSMEFRERIISGLFFPWVRLNYYTRFMFRIDSQNTKAGAEKCYCNDGRSGLC